MQQMHYHKKVYCSRVKGNVILEQLIERQQSLLFCKNFVDKSIIENNFPLSSFFQKTSQF